MNTPSESRDSVERLAIDLFKAILDSQKKLPMEDAIRAFNQCLAAIRASRKPG